MDTDINIRVMHDVLNQLAIFNFMGNDSDSAIQAASIFSALCETTAIQETSYSDSVQAASINIRVIQAAMYKEQYFSTLHQKI
jgi:hypothetical protein